MPITPLPLLTSLPSDPQPASPPVKKPAVTILSQETKGNISTVRSYDASERVCLEQVFKNKQELSIEKKGVLALPVDFMDRLKSDLAGLSANITQGLEPIVSGQATEPNRVMTQELPQQLEAFEAKAGYMMDHVLPEMERKIDMALQVTEAQLKGSKTPAEQAKYKTASEELKNYKFRIVHLTEGFERLKGQTRQLRMQVKNYNDMGSQALFPLQVNFKSFKESQLWLQNELSDKSCYTFKNIHNHLPELVGLELACSGII